MTGSERPDGLAPETTAPETTAPETTAPETTAPETTAPEAPARPTRRQKPRSKWRRRLRTANSRLLFTAFAAALCFLFLLPFLYAVSQSLSSAGGFGGRGGPGGPGSPGSQAATDVPWYPAAQRTYPCTDSTLCTYQKVTVDYDGTVVPDGDPVDVSQSRRRDLPVYDVPDHGSLALLHPNPGYTDLPSDFIDPQTNKRVEVVVDVTTLEPVWEFHVSLDSFDGAFRVADSLTQAAPGGFLRWLLNSGIISGVSAIGAVLSSVLVAYGFARFKFRGRDVLFLVVIATILIPYQVTLIPQYIIYHTLGWDATFLPLTIPNFFGNAYFIFLLRQYFMTLPRELDEAAMVDGAGHFRVLTNIIVPQAWPAIAAVALFQFLFSWNDFIGPLIYLSSWDDLTPVSLGLTFMGGGGPVLAAAAILSLAVPLVLAFAAQRAFMRGIVISGVEN
jgi:multiple sugar transport system permease protein